MRALKQTRSQNPTTPGILNFKDKKVVIMGLGNYEHGSGVSAALLFARARARVLITDLSSEKQLARQIKRLKKYSNIEFVLGEHRDKDFENSDFIIKNPSVPKGSRYLKIAGKNKIPIYNDWSVFLKLKNNFLVGVTGSKGKSTTTTLINEFLKEKYKTHLCGNIGVSPLAILYKIKKNDILVAELSSWGLQGFEAVRKSPNISVVTNLFPEHLNKYKNLEEYYKDKDNIFRFQSLEDYLIINRDNEELRERGKNAKSRIFWFSKKPFKGNGVYVKGGEVFFSDNRKTELVYLTKDIKLPGLHNLENVLAAVCVAMIMGIERKYILKVLRDFKGIPNRFELIGEINGIKYYNDTTATTPDATIAALKTLNSKKVILLAGGADKKLDYRELAKTIPKFVKTLILFKGEASDKLLHELRIKNYESRENHNSYCMIRDSKIPVIANILSMKIAFQIAQGKAKSGDIILLSPAAASFGIFKNEFDRGDQFCELVRNEQWGVIVDFTSIKKNGVNMGDILSRL